MNNINVGEGRDPNKRKVKPVEGQSLLDLHLEEGESSDDSDFRIEDHPEDSDDYSINSNDDNKAGDDSGASSSSDESDDSDDGFKTTTKAGEPSSISALLEKAKSQEFKFPGDLANTLICAGCLGSRSDDFNEIVECDGCGVTVHEGCYGVSDVTSESSTVSSASTEPWFCEACKAGVTNPTCELCPNLGGIFKETEVGAWVHLVCALYVPGVAFSEVERLSGVTLFEMAYSRWGARSCALCGEAALARTGVAIECDAGLCRTFFHVTCGQREGLLAEAHTEEVDQADPFYAHCKLHSDKALVKKRKRNWLALQIRTEMRKQEMLEKLSDDEKKRIERKLLKYKRKYQQQKESRNPPWVPTQKMARMLYSSAWAMRKFQSKAELMGVDLHALEFEDQQISALKDVSRRWHVPPAFSVEFVAYYLDRNSRVNNLRASLDQLTKDNAKLKAGEDQLTGEYHQASKENTDAIAELKSLRESMVKMYEAVKIVCPSKTMPEILLDTPLLPIEYQRSTPKVTPQQLQKRCSVPTAAALKMGVGFPLSDHPDARHGKVLSTSLAASESVFACAVCSRRSEAEVLASCDVCSRHYHIHCLDPPLPRPPKKTKLYGWQCSECDKSSDSEPDVNEKKVPRRSRIRYSKDGAIISDPLSPGSNESTPPKSKAKKLKQNLPIKVTIKQFDFDTDEKKKEKKIKRKKEDSPKKLKRSFTSPTLTNTPLMSITPLVADSPNDSQNENSNISTSKETSFASQNTSFSSLLEKSKFDTNIETTLANLSSDIAEYKANRKRRKEKHRSRYSPDLLRVPSKHKHKRKKKNQDMENPAHHPRITIKIKPIPKPDGSFDTQMFYVPTDSNDGPPPSALNRISMSQEELPESSLVSRDQLDSSLAQNKDDVVPTKPKKLDRTQRGRGSNVSKKSAANMTPLTSCDVCSNSGDGTNLVRCDECLKRYHFNCLEPPLNKNPKKRGYSWHCADCDPTDLEDNH